MRRPLANALDIELAGGLTEQVTPQAGSARLLERRRSGTGRRSSRRRDCGKGAASRPRGPGWPGCGRQSTAASGRAARRQRSPHGHSSHAALPSLLHARRIYGFGAAPGCCRNLSRCVLSVHSCGGGRRETRRRTTQPHSERLARQQPGDEVGAYRKIRRMAPRPARSWRTEQTSAETPW